MKINLKIDKELMRIAGYMLAGALALAIIYVGVVKHKTRQLTQTLSSLGKMQAELQQYHDFEGFQARLSQERDKITELSSDFNNNLFADGQTEKDFLNEIGNICQQTGIKLDRTNPANLEGVSGPAWDIGFSADFPRLYGFLGALEKSYRIEKLDMQKGARGIDVDMAITPLPRSGKISDTLADATGDSPEGKPDIFALYDMVDNLVKKIEQKQTESGTDIQVQKDPFTGESLFRKPVVQAKPQQRAVVIDSPDISIDGIYWDPSTPVAVVAGEALKEGDTKKGVKIVKILEDKVIVEWHAHEFTLRANKKGE